MTPAGAQKLQDELARLKEERPKISREIGIAREHGDLSENAEYHAAKERQGMVEARIKDIEDKLAAPKSSIRPSCSGDRVRFGATVDLYQPRHGRRASPTRSSAPTKPTSTNGSSRSLRRSRAP